MVQINCKLVNTFLSLFDDSMRRLQHFVGFLFLSFYLDIEARLVIMKVYSNLGNIKVR